MDVVALLGVALQLDGLIPQEIIQALPEPLSASGALFYGAWGLFSYAVVTKVGGLLRSSGSPTNATVEGSGASVGKGTTTVGTTSNTGPSLKKGDHAAFTLPAFLPLSKGVRSVSHNEVHAIELGLVVGFVISWLTSIGRQNVAVFLSVMFIAGALGYKRYRTKAFKTVRLEPWYAMMAFAVGGGIGWLFFSPDLAVLQGLSLPV